MPARRPVELASSGEALEFSRATGRAVTGSFAELRVPEHVIQVRMRDEVRVDEGAGDVRSIGPRGGVRQCETCKGTFGECKGERGEW